ncbi:Ig-like domain-containing protein [Cohnella sp. 56]|uniref:Ig-like domain-containing protein n=1 Tax=Cohnella sp. 56 TaxID=3113722 RepID=UPI0030E92628
MDNKNTGKLPAWHRKSQILTLTVLLGVAPLAQAGTANAAGEAILAAPVKNLDVKWIAGYAGNNASGAPIEINGSTMTIDLANHTSWQIKPGMKLSASSDSTAVSVSIVGSKLAVTVLGAGTANIDLKAATDDGSVSATDRVQFLITKIGDTTGDGLVTSADALYITKVVNSKVPLSDEEINRLDINRDGKVTSADATALLANYVGKTGPQSFTYIVSIKEVNDAPFVTEAAISGTLKTGATLTAASAYRDVEADAEGVSEYKWYKGLAADGSDKAPIAGATNRTYAVQDEDVGYFLFAEITPVAAEGKTRGETVIVSTDMAIPDTTPPALAATNALTPTGTVAKGDMAKDFVMTFTEKVKAGAGSIKLRKVSGGSEAVSYAANDTAHVTIAGDTVTIKNPGLEDVTAYYVEVEPTAIVDLAGNAYAGTQGSTTWTFTTPDTTAPILLSKTPAAGSQQAPKSAGVDFVLTFNEPVKAVTGKKVQIYRVGDTEPLRAYDADSANVVVNGTTVSIKHPELTETESYEVRIEAGAFADLSDNAFAGLTSGWSFTVPDTTPPALAATNALTPTGTVAKGDMAKDFVMTFTEKVKAGAGSIKLRKVSGGSEAVSYAANDTAHVTIAGDTVTIKNPGLEDVTAYYVEVEPTAIVDLAGNAYAGTQGSTTWTFTTPDTTAPVLVSKTPAAGSQQAPKSAGVDFVLTFSEPVKAVSDKYVWIYRGAETTPFLTYNATDSANVVVNGTSVSIKHLELTETESYEVRIEAGAFADLSDNDFAGLTSGWSFTVPDTTAPALAATNALTPMGTVAKGDMAKDFVMTFTEKVKAGTGSIKLRKVSGGSEAVSYAANDTAHVTIAGDTVTIKNPGLEDVTAYYVEVEPTAIVDLAGNAYAGTQGSTTWTFTTPDTTAPVLVSKTPAAGSLQAPKSESVDFVLTFNEPVKAVSDKKVQIYRVGDTEPLRAYDADSANVVVNGTTVSIKHPELTETESYEVRIEAGAFADLSDNAFAGLTSGWSFTVPDTTPPALAATNALTPTGTVAKGDMAKDFVMTFTEKVKAGAGSIKLRKVSGGSEAVSYAANDTAHVTIAGDTVTIKNPGLEDVTAYYVEVEPTAIVDLAGNAYAGTQGSTTWTFTTPDTTAPVLVSKTPAAGSQQAPKSESVDFVLTFNEPVKAVTGKKVQIYRVGDTTPLWTYDVDSANVVVNGTTVSIKHPELTETESYEVRIEAGAFADLSDNAFAGLTSGWSFTVPDTTAPVISGVAPANQTVRVNASSDLTISFNEAVRAVAGHAIKVYNAASPSTPLAVIQADDTAHVTISGGKVTIANPGLSDNAAYYVDVPAGAFEDLAGNAAPAIAGSSAWSFRTPDTIAPTLTTKTPADGAVTNSKDFEATLKFSEPVKAAAGKHITIYKASDDTEALKFDADDTVNVNINGNTVTLPFMHMDDDTAYYATVDKGAFTDAEGNEYAGITGKTAWRFTTPDVFPPTAVTLSPVRQATGVSLTDDFVIHFSEPVLTGNGTIRIFRATDNALIASYTADDTTKVTVNGSQATIRNPGLADETEYYIEISSFAFRDAAGNKFSGFTGEQGVWRFTTPDTAAPVISTLTPAHQGTGVSQTDDIKIVFNENIKAVSGKRIAIRNAADDSLFAEFDAADTANVTVSGKTLLVAHAKLADAMAYYVDVEAGAVTDTTGNAFAGISGKSAWRFTAADSRTFEVQNVSDLSEKQMNEDGGAILILTITGDQFQFDTEKDSNGDPVLDADNMPVMFFNTANIQLNHAPAGVTILSADKIDDGSLMLSLDFDGTPMSADVTDFSVTVVPSGLVSGKTITSNAMTITALPRMLAITNRTPAAGETDTDKRGALGITFDKAVTAAAGKTISIRRKSDDGLVQSINANDASKVTVNGAAVTIQPNMLNNLTDYYVQMDAGAFVSGDGSASPAISAKTDWPFRTIEEIPGPYFSQYLDAGDGRIALELYNTGAQDATGYSVVVYKYMKATKTIQTTNVPILKIVPNMPFIYIDTIFYDAFDKMNIWYYNDELDLYNPNSFSVTAIVLKNSSGKVIDVLGNPNATTDAPFMPSGGTIIRKPQTYGGSPKFQLGQWNSFPKGTLNYFGTHTN